MTTREEKYERLYQSIAKLQATMHKRVPPDEVMNAIREHFATPVHFIEATRIGMMNAGVPKLDAFLYSMIPDLTRAKNCEKNGKRPMLNTLSRMGDYVQSLFIGVHVECFYLILLNNNGRLIYTQLLQKGGEDSAPFYLRPLLYAVLREGAKYIVLAHNHPRGTLRPSNEDLMCTLQTLNAVVPIQVTLLDHIIIARRRIVSIRETSLIPDILWTINSKNTKIVREWLDVEYLIE